MSLSVYRFEAGNMGWLAWYWNRVSRISEVEMPSAASVYPNYYEETAVMCLAFTLISMVIPIIIKNLFPQWYNSLDSKKQKEVPSYILCLIHHLVQVPWAWYRVYIDFQMTDAEQAVYNYTLINAAAAPFFTGYTVGDTLSHSIWEALQGKYEYIIHHIIILAVIYTGSEAPNGQLAKYIPHLLLCDTTNILFNTAWLLRTMNMRDSSIVFALEILFVIFFLLTRVVHLPLFLYSIIINYGETIGVGWLLTIFFPFVMLQW